MGRSAVGVTTEIVMPKVWIGLGEDYRYGVKDMSGYAPGLAAWYATELEVDEATLARWRKAAQDYERAQEEMRVAVGGPLRLTAA